MRVLLADDHTLVRAGMRALLQSLPDVEIVAEASDGRQAVERTLATQPDVALLDISMPSLNGLAVAERLKREFNLTFAEGYGLTETAAPCGGRPVVVSITRPVSRTRSDRVSVKSMARCSAPGCSSSATALEASCEFG